MYGKIQAQLQKELQEIQDGGIYKRERIITSPQGANVTVESEIML